jgi:hypothetical protein
MACPQGFSKARRPAKGHALEHESIKRIFLALFVVFFEGMGQHASQLRGANTLK